jgi:tetratricopeptide (TPR) repeat protein
MKRLTVAVLAVIWQLGGCRTQPPRAAPSPATSAPGATAPAASTAPPAAVPTRPVPEATSLLSRPLYPPPLDRDALITRGLELADAQAAFREDPLDEQNIIWFGRRLAYVGRYRQAIAVYSDGLILHPNSFKLLRHRGHRYITTRRLDLAIDDLTRATALIEDVPDEIEPDGRPNARNIPTSTSHTNISYHLGLAHYVKGEFAPALDAYRRCLTFADNDDMTCAAIYWLYLTLRRLGSDDEAAMVLEPVHADMDIIENFAYHRLLLLYKGELTLQQVLQGAGAPSPVGAAVDDATLAYGVGAWHLLNGDLDQAYAKFHEIIEGGAWPAFGHIAAEAELARWVVRAVPQDPPIGGSRVPSGPAAPGSL